MAPAGLLPAMTEILPEARDLKLVNEPLRAGRQVLPRRGEPAPYVASSGPQTQSLPKGPHDAPQPAAPLFEAGPVPPQQVPVAAHVAVVSMTGECALDRQVTHEVVRLREARETTHRCRTPPTPETPHLNADGLPTSAGCVP